MAGALDSGGTLAQPDMQKYLPAACRDVNGGS
jgi:hypothetical protein